MQRQLAIAATLAAAIVATPAAAGSSTVNGTIYATTAGTTVDYWRIDMPVAGMLTVDVLAYESTDNTLAKGKDLNGDGMITFLDPDTSLFRNSGGALKTTDWILRCDDVGNSNGSCASTLGSADGSIHARDPYFSVNLAAGSYIYVMGDYRTTIDEGIARLNAGDSLRNGGNHGDYRITFSAETPFTVAAVPEPESYAMLLAGLGLMGAIARRRKA